MPNINSYLKFAGNGSGEGRASRRRSRHCNRRRSRKPGHRSMPPKHVRFSREKARFTPHRHSHGAFFLLVVESRDPRRVVLLPSVRTMLRCSACAAALVSAGGAISHAQAPPQSPVTAAPATTPAFREVTDEL